MAANKENQNAVGNHGGGRAKSGEISFLMGLMNGQVSKKDDCPENSLKRVIYELAIEKKEIKIVNKILDKLYANNTNVDVTSDGQPFIINIGRYAEDRVAPEKPIEP